MKNIFDFYHRYQAESNGSLQDFNEQKRKEQQKLEEIKVHIQQSLFLQKNWGKGCTLCNGLYREAPTKRGTFTGTGI